MVNQVTLGKTGITVSQNGFGALPIQRVDMETAAQILRRAFEGGMTFFDTARAYSDSEEKIGYAFEKMWPQIRNQIVLATKTHGENEDELRNHLKTSLELLKTDYVDIYQLHCAPKCYRPGDGTGLYEALIEAKRQGKVRHIGITTHKIDVAFEAVESGLYETIQFPFSYLASPKEIELVNKAREYGVGFIAMKGLAGGLINNPKAAFAYMSMYDNVVPIWGIQRMTELEEWLSYMKESPLMDEKMKSFIESEQNSLKGEFCRGCGYCMPCPAGIEINNCARMSLMLRRAPSEGWLSEENQAKMKKIESCLNCGRCSSKCPYELDTPSLLKKNYEDYKQILAGGGKV